MPALLILGVVAGVYVLTIVVDALRSLRRRKLRGKRRGAQWRRRLPIALIAGAIVSLLFAFGQVRLDKQVTSGTVVLAIDVSHSMGATDVEPNRLAAAEAAASSFLDRVPVGFRVGLATFSATSAVPVAPTSDRTQVSDALGSLAVDTGTGTVIGDGLSAALDAIQADRGGGDRPAAVVLLSDGMDSGSSIPPEDAAARARQMDVAVYTVAIGQPASEASAVAGGSASAAAPSDVLAGIAEATGAKAYTTQTAGPAHPGVQRARFAAVDRARDRRERRTVRDRCDRDDAHRRGGAPGRDTRPLRVTDLVLHDVTDPVA